MDLPSVVDEVVKEMIKPMVGGILGLVRKIPALFRRSGKAEVRPETAETAETPEPATYRQTVTGGSAGAQGPGAQATVNNYSSEGKPSSSGDGPS